MTPPAAYRATELECQGTIIAAAKALGWLIHAERTARTQSGGWATPVQGHTGFPDLVLARGPQVLFVELKRRPNRVEPAQAAWHQRLRAAGADVRVWWVPEELDDIIRFLQTPDRPPTEPVARNMDAPFARLVDEIDAAAHDRGGR